MAVAWEDEAIVLGLASFGESRLRISLLTAQRGRYVAMLSGGRKTHAGVTPGAVVRVRWKARLSEHMGTATIDLLSNPMVRFWSNAIALAAASNALATAEVVPEREPHPWLYQCLLATLSDLRINSPAECLVRWDVVWLREMGFGLELDACAVHSEDDSGNSGNPSNSGNPHDLHKTSKLKWISPRTGRAVCSVGAAGWEHRLIRLPPMLATIATELSYSEAGYSGESNDSMISMDVQQPEQPPFATIASEPSSSPIWEEDSNLTEQEWASSMLEALEVCSRFIKQVVEAATGRDYKHCASRFQVFEHLQSKAQCCLRQNHHKCDE